VHRDKSTDTHRAPEPQERNLCWELDFRVVCLEAVIFDVQFPSIMRAALGHIVGISRIMKYGRLHSARQPGPGRVQQEAVR